MASLNETHDSKLKSWVASANEAGADFPIQNLPLGIFSPPGEAPRAGIAIGDRILDLNAVAKAGIFDGLAAEAAEAASASTLNRLMGLGPKHWSALRLAASRLLREGGGREAEAMLAPMGAAQMHVPAAIGDYTDFYASVFHATNIGKLLRPDNPLLPNYKWVPIAYHGRASSVVVSGTKVRRPKGQTKAPEAAAPVFGPAERLDYEMEMGFFVGPGNEDGTPIPVDDAAGHIFGFCLVNDWSARDIQAWEYQPLGPFLAKSFATTISPWIVTAEALEPFRAPAFTRPNGDPAPLPHLASARDAAEGGYDIAVEVLLSTRTMRDAGAAPHRLSRGSFRDAYWTVAQMVAHHTSNGCNLRPGDLIASGTLSGDARESWGALLELTGGKSPLALPSGEERIFLQDGDEVVMRGTCARDGFASLGLGECRGAIEAALG